ncbi:MAG: hypothetical protein J6N49_05615 [Alphaproteobacteria bacterium]|nr:hypothetical protein [Alphaproteobacteria bacterium]
MKKSVFVLIAALSIALTGCTTFDSDPIEPKIIGTTFLQEEKGLIFAEFDSVRYAPTIIYTGEKIGRDGIDGTIKPIAGMQVTVFTSNIHKEPVFFAGRTTVEQIEKYYQRNLTFVIILVAVIVCFLFITVIQAITSKQTIEVGVINADV